MKMGGGKIVFSVLLEVFDCSSFWLLDMTIRFLMVGSSTERTLYLLGVINDLVFLMQAEKDGDCGEVDNVDQLRLFLFLSSLFLLIIWLLTILIRDTVFEAIGVQRSPRATVPVVNLCLGNDCDECAFRSSGMILSNLIYK